MIEFYQKNRSEIYSIKRLANELVIEYPFEFLSIRNQTDIGIVLLVSIKPPYKSMSLTYDQKTCELITDSIYLSQCDSCTESERNTYNHLIKEKRIKELLQLFLKLKPNAILITSDGVFFALGWPLNHRNKSEVEGGIFLPFGKEFLKEQIVKQIEGENAFLYDTVVE
jgi:hypothetical protein